MILHFTDYVLFSAHRSLFTVKAIKSKKKTKKEEKDREINEFIWNSDHTVATT